jgi:hypothetical protein
MCFPLNDSLAKSSILNIANQNKTSCMGWIEECPNAKALVDKIINSARQWEKKTLSFGFDDQLTSIIRDIEEVEVVLEILFVIPFMFT